MKIVYLIRSRKTGLISYAYQNHTNAQQKIEELHNNSLNLRVVEHYIDAYTISD